VKFYSLGAVFDKFFAAKTCREQNEDPQNGKSIEGRLINAQNLRDLWTRFAFDEKNTREKYKNKFIEEKSSKTFLVEFILHNNQASLPGTSS
jgi:hypothetical protein